MALRQPLGASSGDLMREDALTCSEHIRLVTRIAAVYGAFAALPLCGMHYGPRVTRPRLMRWSLAGAAVASGCALVQAVLWEPACEPQNVAAYDRR
ncbi:hypothetical protein CLOM_g10588 [Closterium sp. NIES-68]|nr:hypothetical protein CLOM_g10588 [Closterium sp. NIES-68]GJP83492.1 hypothetical protein CLOP_g13638 [Closterium sp. NIES-67]